MSGQDLVSMPIKESTSVKIDLITHLEDREDESTEGTTTMGLRVVYTGEVYRAFLEDPARYSDWRAMIVKVKTSAFGDAANAHVDTGCAWTTATTSWLAEYAAHVEPRKLFRPSRVATGNGSVVIYEYARVHIMFEAKELIKGRKVLYSVLTPVLISPSDDTFLLIGADILSTEKAVVDYVSNTLKFHEGKVEVRMIPSMLANVNGVCVDLELKTNQ